MAGSVAFRGEHCSERTSRRTWIAALVAVGEQLRPPSPHSANDEALPPFPEKRVIPFDPKKRASSHRIPSLSLLESTNPSSNSAWLLAAPPRIGYIDAGLHSPYPLHVIVNDRSRPFSSDTLPLIKSHSFDVHPHPEQTQPI